MVTFVKMVVVIGAGVTVATTFWTVVVIGAGLIIATTTVTTGGAVAPELTTADGGVTGVAPTGSVVVRVTVTGAGAAAAAG